MIVPIAYVSDWMISKADSWFATLRDELAWVQRDTTPRQEYYINAVNTPYTYGSGDFARTYSPQPMHPIVREIQTETELIAGCKFEVCFLNRYLTQSNHLGWHSDNSPEMDDTRPIAIVSLGVSREIWFRPINSVDQVTKIKLASGSLCLMHAGMQDSWQHRIPKASFQCGERISLTFRGYVPLVISN